MYHKVWYSQYSIVFVPKCKIHQVYCSVDSVVLHALRGKYSLLMYSLGVLCIDSPACSRDAKVAFMYSVALMITFPEVVTSHNEDGSAIVTLNGHYID